MEAKRIFDEKVNTEIEKRMAERDAEQERLDKIQAEEDARIERERVAAE